MSYRPPRPQPALELIRTTKTVVSGTGKVYTVVELVRDLNFKRNSRPNYRVYKT